MSSSVMLHVMYRIANAPILTFPFPHIYVEDVFPPEFYAILRRNLPPNDGYVRLIDTGLVSKGYSQNRLTLFPKDDHIARLPESLREFWRDTLNGFLGEEFGRVNLGKFMPTITQRFAKPGNNRPMPILSSSEVALVRDLASYALGPHSDSPSKLVSLLFYMPENDSRPHLGTALYMPKDRRFTCPGGPHYKFDKFDHVATMPYCPNTLFAFPKTTTSFHGVQPLPAGASDRDLLQYDLRRTKIPATAAPLPGGQPRA
jgi:hypothetical protein